MSFVEIDGLNIHYELKGKKGKVVLLLHGWGQNTTMMEAIQNFLCAHFKVYNLDFPGFGKSDEPAVAWTNDDYVEFINQFIKHFKIKNPIIIGHSFGCRVALAYAYRYPVYKMVLTGAAGIKDKRGAAWYLKTYGFKIGKVLLSPFKGLTEKVKKKVGSEDYKNANAIMRGTLVNCVNFDITPYLKDIKPETLLVYGSIDSATPLWMGKQMEKEMPNATLVIFEGDDHFAYFHQAERFNKVLEAFLRVDYD